MLFEQLNEIDAVSKADIRRVANQVFTARNRTYAMIEFTPPKPPGPKPVFPPPPQPTPAQTAPQGGH